MSFFAQLQKRKQELGSLIGVGIDPHFGLLDGFLKQEFVQHGEKKFLQLFCNAHIQAAALSVSAVKFQSSFFEAMGIAGMSVLKESISLAKNLGLKVILDAKRGDISSTMAAYGKSAFETFGADCLTVTPYLGKDVLEALLPWLKEGRGVYIVWHTSNAHDKDLQNLTLWDGRKVFEAVYADILAYAQRHHIETQLGWVLGATRVSALHPHFRQSLKGSSFLLPGVGAQGAQVDRDLKSFLFREGVSPLIPISRGLSFGKENKNLKNWNDYEALIQSRLQYFNEMINK